MLSLRKRSAEIIREFLATQATLDFSYDILAFSRPRHLLARLGYPLARRTQKRFARDSAAMMLRAAGKSTTASN